MKPVVLIFGPTASGKTALSLHLANKFNGEIISADSMQIYQKMNIGTAKASVAERAQIPHHLIDICDIHTAFSTGAYREMAINTIRDIQARKKLPIVAGGTGLYFDAILNQPTYGMTQASPKVRRELELELQKQGAAALHAKLRQIDPVTAERIHPNDEKRIVRALEIYTVTNQIPSAVLQKSPNTEFDFLCFYLNYENRADLYRACDKRVLNMLEEGLLDEVKELLGEGLSSSPTASQAIGYKELTDYFNGTQTLDEAVEIIQRRTRNYAKRQITWFSKMSAIPLPASDEKALCIAENKTAEFLKGALC